jgi:hypothetical protein
MRSPSFGAPTRRGFSSRMRWVSAHVRLGFDVPPARFRGPRPNPAMTPFQEPLIAARRIVVGASAASVAARKEAPSPMISAMRASPGLLRGRHTRPLTLWQRICLIAPRSIRHRASARGTPDGRPWRCKAGTRISKSAEPCSANPPRAKRDCDLVSPPLRAETIRLHGHQGGRLCKRSSDTRVPSLQR